MHQEIKELLDIEPSGAPLISLYLDTTRPAGTRQFEPWLRSRLKAIERSLSEEEVVPFERAARHLWEAVDAVPADVAGVAVFACEDPKVLKCLPSDKPYSNQVAVSHAPVVYPLVRRLDEHVAVAALVVDKELARIYTVRLGKIAQAATVAHAPEHPEKPGRPSARHGNGYGASELKYQRRLRQQSEHYLLEVVEALRRVVEREHIGMLVLAGNQQVTHQIEKHLPPGLHEKLVATHKLPAYSSEQEVLRLTLTDLEGTLETRRKALASSLVHEFRQGGLAVLGTGGTLRALFRGQAEEVLLHPGFGAHGRLCLECGQPASDAVEACPLCQGSLGPSIELRELIARQAEQTGALVEEADAAELVAWEGIGAWLRFPEA